MTNYRTVSRSLSSTISPLSSRSSRSSRNTYARPISSSSIYSSISTIPHNSSSNSTIYASPRTISAQSIQSTNLIPNVFYAIPRRHSAPARMTRYSPPKNMTRRRSIGGKVK